jgi:hypothetical protein
MELGLIQREIPFGAPSASAKRSLTGLPIPFVACGFEWLRQIGGFSLMRVRMLVGSSGGKPSRVSFPLRGKNFAVSGSP